MQLTDYVTRTHAELMREFLQRKDKASNIQNVHTTSLIQTK